MQGAGSLFAGVKQTLQACVLCLYWHRGPVDAQQHVVTLALWHTTESLGILLRGSSALLHASWAKWECYGEGCARPPAGETHCVGHGVRLRMGQWGSV